MPKTLENFLESQRLVSPNARLLFTIILAQLIKPSITLYKNNLVSTLRLS